MRGDFQTADALETALANLDQRERLDSSRGSVLNGTAAMLWENRTRNVAGGEPAILRHLQDQLAAVLSAVRNAGIAADDLDPAAAIANSRVTEHQLALEALAAFRDILMGVRDWHAAHDIGNGNPLYWTTTLVPVPLEVDGLIGVALAGCHAWCESTGERYDGTTVWPDLDDEDARGLALIWLASRDDLTGHLPTVREFKAREAALRAAKSDALAAANGALRMRVWRDGSLTKRRIEGTPEARRRAVTVSNHHAETDDQWHVRHSTNDVTNVFE